MLKLRCAPRIKDFEAARKKALAVGAKKFYLEVRRLSYNSDGTKLIAHLIAQDLKREFVTELIYPALQANCIYEVRMKAPCI